MKDPFVYPKGLNAFHILALPIGENAAEAETIGGYLRELLIQLWVDGGEFFSPRSPFGLQGEWRQPIWDALRPLGVQNEVECDAVIKAAVRDLLAVVAAKTAMIPPVG